MNPNPSLEEMRDLRVCGDKAFLEKVTENTLAIYQAVVDSVLERSGTSWQFLIYILIHLPSVVPLLIYRSGY